MTPVLLALVILAALMVAAVWMAVWGIKTPEDGDEGW